MKAVGAGWVAKLLVYHFKEPILGRRRLIYTYSVDFLVAGDRLSRSLNLRSVRLQELLDSCILIDLGVSPNQFPESELWNGPTPSDISCATTGTQFNRTIADYRFLKYFASNIG